MSIIHRVVQAHLRKGKSEAYLAADHTDVDIRWVQTALKNVLRSRGLPYEVQEPLEELEKALSDAWTDFSQDRASYHNKREELEYELRRKLRKLDEDLQEATERTQKEVQEAVRRLKIRPLIEAVLNEGGKDPETLLQFLRLLVKFE